ncbi:MAG: YncE family protein [Gemmatimonas sp.]
MRTLSRPFALLCTIAPSLLITNVAPVVAQGSANQPVSSIAGTLIVTNKTPSTATLIDMASGSVLATLPTGQGPHEVVMSRDGSTAVVTDYGAGAGGSTLTVIDVPGKRVARTIALGAYRRPHGIVFMPGDSIVAVTSETNRFVLLVRIATGEIVKAIPTEQNGSHMVGIVRDGTRGWTGNIGSNTVSELDFLAGRSLRTIAVPAQPEAINVTPDGREVWVGSNATGKISVVDAASGNVTTVAEGFGWPYRVLFSPDNATVLMPDLRNEELRFIDRSSRKELHRMPYKDAGPQGIIFTPDGKYAIMSLSKNGRVAIIDVKARKQVGHIMTGDTPDGVAFTTRVTK